MVRKVRKAQKKAGMAFFADLLKSQGVSITAEDLEDEIDGGLKQETRMLQTEGVLLFLQSAGKALLPKVCKECNESFATRYISVAYCSDMCRANALSKVGIKWDRFKDHYALMNAEKPMVVGKETYQTLLQFARHILEGGVILQEEDQNPPQFPETLLPEHPLEQFPKVEVHTTPEESPVPLDTLEPFDFQSADFPEFPSRL